MLRRQKKSTGLNYPTEFLLAIPRDDNNNNNHNSINILTGLCRNTEMCPRAQTVNPATHTIQKKKKFDIMTVPLNFCK